MGELRWEAPTGAADGAWVELLGAIEEVDRRGEVVGPEDVADEWASLWSHPETDALFVWDGGDLVAFGWIKTLVGEREHHRVECWGGVRPSHRRRGIGRDLLRRQVARAREIAVRIPGDLPVRIGLEAGDHQTDLLALATRAGFSPERRFLEIARPVSEPVAPPTAPAGLRLVPWDEAWDERIRVAHTETFAGHWGTEPRTPQEWRQWYTGHRGFRPDLSYIAEDEGRDEVAGFVLAAAYPNDWDSCPREAWIHTLGTRPAWRGRGIARWLLTRTLGAVADADDGFEQTILGVDAENPTGALCLYRSLGFVDVRATLRLGLQP
ncbi:MAG: GNAT family N-acetyltransferase [Acidimicrobiales bacterium]|nr:GNAT family N-acetyltransferase [Acidimicrobiales bacterium]